MVFMARRTDGPAIGSDLPDGATARWTVIEHRLRRSVGPADGQ